MLLVSPELQKPKKPMAKCHFHSFPTPLASCCRQPAHNPSPGLWESEAHCSQQLNTVA